MIQEYIEAVTTGHDLTQPQARDAATTIFDDATHAQIGALLAGLRTKGETEAEIAGLAQGMRDAAHTITPDRSPLVDTCGTGGDDYDTINISTTSAIVASGAGLPIAKHGNYSVSSSSGSADVLEALDVVVDSQPPTVEHQIETQGIGFMLAPVFHPAMKAVIGPRKELGVRTVFNILGPLTNPAGADAQLLGVYDPDLVPVLARALARMDVDRGLVVHGSGLDEICLHDTTTVAEVRGDTIDTYDLTPADMGLDTAPITAVSGGDPHENAADLRAIVTGDRTGPKRDIILANAGAAIYIADQTPTLEAGVEAARDAIDSGAAADKLHALQEAVPNQ